MGREVATGVFDFDVALEEDTRRASAPAFVVREAMDMALDDERSRRASAPGRTRKSIDMALDDEDFSCTVKEWGDYRCTVKEWSDYHREFSPSSTSSDDSESCVSRDSGEFVDLTACEHLQVARRKVATIVHTSKPSRSVSRTSRSERSPIPAASRAVSKPSAKTSRRTLSTRDETAPRSSATKPRWINPAYLS